MANSELDNKIGTPQGSVLSPLMANIYLHGLDVMLVRLRDSDEFNRPRIDKVSEEYKANMRIQGTE